VASKEACLTSNEGKCSFWAKQSHEALGKFCLPNATLILCARRRVAH